MNIITEIKIIEYLTKTMLVDYMINENKCIIQQMRLYKILK